MDKKITKLPSTQSGMMTPMLMDATSVRKVAALTLKGSIISKGFSALIEWVERQTKGQLVYDKSIFPYRLPELSDLFHLAEKMKQAGVITAYQRSRNFSDEPQLKNWSVTCNTENEHMAGGLAFNDERPALTSALAEAMERYVWITGSTHVQTHPLSIADGAKQGAYVLPYVFNSFSKLQRTSSQRLSLSDAQIFAWAKGFSLTKNTKCYVPAQTVTRQLARRLQKNEPTILTTVTNGLATWPTQSGARLMGALELIERDAFMVMWLTQTSPERVDLDDLTKAYPELKKNFEDCVRYQLSPYVLYLRTDAPTHTIAVVLEDVTGNEPRFSIGLKAHQNIARAVQGALLESLRARSNTRSRLSLASAAEIRNKKVHELKHTDRAIYWAKPENAEKLSFLIGGKNIMTPKKEWENENITDHLSRIVQWCKESSYDFVSVSLTDTKKNVTPWHIEMTLIPQLHPMHQDESLPYLNETRARKLFETEYKNGFPLTHEPHPFV